MDFRSERRRGTWVGPDQGIQTTSAEQKRKKGQSYLVSPSPVIRDDKLDDDTTRVPDLYCVKRVQKRVRGTGKLE